MLKTKEGNKKTCTSNTIERTSFFVKTVYIKDVLIKIKDLSF